MVNNTPLRLIAIEEQPSRQDDDQNGSPVEMITEHDAITRKVLEASLVDGNGSPAVRRPLLRFKVFALAIVVVAMAVVGLVAALGGKGAAAPTPQVGSTRPVPSQAVPMHPSAPPLAVSPQSSAPPLANPEVIRLQIVAEPMEAELSLDGNVLAGHRLNLDVPKDRGVHVISASAPGYVPFNQQVSFSSDVVLNIGLRRGHTHPAHQAARPRPSPIESAVKSGARPATTQSSPHLEPGMNLDDLPARRGTKSIDERNPYKP